MITSAYAWIKGTSLLVKAGFFIGSSLALFIGWKMITNGYIAMGEKRENRKWEKAVKTVETENRGKEVRVNQFTIKNDTARAKTHQKIENRGHETGNWITRNEPANGDISGDVMRRLGAVE